MQNAKFIPSIFRAEPTTTIDTSNAVIYASNWLESGWIPHLSGWFLLWLHCWSATNWRCAHQLLLLILLLLNHFWSHLKSCSLWYFVHEIPSFEYFYSLSHVLSYHWRRSAQKSERITRSISWKPVAEYVAITLRMEIAKNVKFKYRHLNYTPRRALIEFC